MSKKSKKKDKEITVEVPKDMVEVTVTTITPPTIWLQNEAQSVVILSHPNEFDEIRESIDPLITSNIIINHLDSESIKNGLTNELAFWIDHHIKSNPTIIFSPTNKSDIDSWIFFCLGKELGESKTLLLWKSEELEAVQPALYRGLTSYYPDQADDE